MVGLLLIYGAGRGGALQYRSGAERSGIATLLSFISAAFFSPLRSDLLLCRSDLLLCRSLGLSSTTLAVAPWSHS